MLINGQWRIATAQFAITNPANNAVIGHAQEACAHDIEDAIAAAHIAFKTWSCSSAYARADVLIKAHQLMLEKKTFLANLMTEEQGKPLKAALNEVQYAADFLIWFAEEAKRIGGSSIASARENQRFITRKQAIGVVAAITPWNYPISMITRKVAPALAAGCTIVLKPAESTPLCAIEVFKILEEAGAPAGVVNLLTTSKPEAIGKAFCEDKRIKKLTFTGSTEVGIHLNTMAASSLKHVSMELGGHAPAIVCCDANPEHAAKGLGLVKFLNSGQACISPNRIFVHHSIYQAFLDTMTQRTQKLNVGSGFDANVAIGPLINQKAITKLENQVADAIKKGAKVLCGGHVLTGPEFDKGHFFAPTVLADITEDMLIYQEETFGPIAAVMPFHSEEEVINKANDTEYGLAAYIYTENFSVANRLMEALNFGIIGINDINPTSAAAPFGGMNLSGLGREGGKEGIEAYLETKLCGYVI